jgi:hypothetical protein
MGAAATCLSPVSTDAIGRWKRNLGDFIAGISHFSVVWFLDVTIVAAATFDYYGHEAITSTTTYDVPSSGVELLQEWLQVEAGRA